MKQTLVIAVLCIFACRLFAASIAEAQAGPTPVIVTAAKQLAIEDRVEALGTLRANESVVLTASVTETVTAIHFEDGQRVEKDTVLVEMTSEEEHAQLEEARSRLEEAKRQYSRIKPLTKGGAAPASLGDERRREFETAGAQLRGIESRLADRLIRAPFSGLIGLRYISVGSLITPGARIATLDDDSVMKLDFSVPSTFLAELKIGIPIVATARAFGDREFKGQIASIDSRIDPVTRSIIVRAILQNDDRALLPGLLMKVVLLKNSREAIVLPEEALIKEGELNSVLIVSESQDKTIVQKKAVTLGARRKGEVEILSGVVAGQKVVTHGTMTARPGAEVQIVSEQEGEEPLKEMLSKGNQGSK